MSLNDKASAALRRELAKAFPERSPYDAGHDRLAEALTKPTHTPGPWTLRSGAFAGLGQQVLSGKDLVATVHSPVGRIDQESPNARLIAAAPDLLAACKRALLAIDTGYLRDPDWESMTLEQKRASRQQSVYNDLESAIAKATK